MFKIKICFIIILAGLPIITHAKTLSCPFSDNFSIDGPVNTHIIKSFVKGNLKMTQPSPAYFSLSCGDSQFRSGDLFIDIGTSDCNKCSLIIHDGPYEMNPSVSYVYCSGDFKFSKLDHVSGSYDYTLEFSKNTYTSYKSA